MVQEQWKQLEMKFFIECGGADEHIFGTFLGKTLHSYNFIDTYLLYTCYLFKPKPSIIVNGALDFVLKAKLIMYCTSIKKKLQRRKRWKYIRHLHLKKKLYSAFFMDGVQLPQVYKSHYEEIVYFLTMRTQKFLVLKWSTLEGWKAEFNLEPPSSFELGTSGLGIQDLQH